MITWASLALLITASPILAWRYTLRRERGRPTPAPEPQDAVPAAYAAHPPLQRPAWAAGTDGERAAENEQTMQIALGGPGGRKE
jgi:hypothetical protein